MATADPCGPGVRMSTPGPRPGGTLDCAAGTTGLPFGRSGSGVPRLGERPPVVVEKRGPYMVTRAPSIQAKLRECGPMGGVSAWAGYLVPRRAPEPCWGDPGGAVLARSRPRKSVRRERVPGVWETRRSGEDPSDPGPLTSREAPGPGQSCSAEKRHAAGLAEPPRLFSEKVSAGAASSVQAISRKGLGSQAGRQSSHVLRPS